jgi:ParB family chromosome partitioning protein
MAADIKRPNLGRGLSALLGGEENEDYAKLDRLRSYKTIEIDLLRPSDFQPRHHMDEDSLDDLARSIGEKGVLQPILVRRHPDDANVFEIIAGERRWRAAQKARLHEVPIVIKELDDREALEIALVENLQRQDLSPLEEADGYRRLMEEFSHTQEDLARSIGKSRSHVANMMRLLNLPETVKTLLDTGALSAGHARALLTANDPAALAQSVVKRGLNVRQTEKLAKSSHGAPKIARKTPQKDTDTLALERDLSNLLGLDVEIKFHGAGGSLILHYRSLDQLDEVLQRLSHGSHGRGGARHPLAPGSHVKDGTGNVDTDGAGDPGSRVKG